MTLTSPPMSDAPTPRTAAAAAPTPQSPVKGAVVPTDAATFRWAAPPGTASFDLRVALASDASTPVVELENLPSTEALLADVLPPGDALWWVRRTGGAWSAPATFRAGTPADVEAARAAAESSEVEAVRQVAKAGPDLDGVPPAPLWPYVEGEALEGAAPLDWATVPGFTAPARDDRPAASAAAPHPLAPLGGAVVDAVGVELQWTAVPDATGYDVELSPHDAFDRDVLTLDAGRATAIGLAGLVPPSGHRLLWRVRARTGDAATPWSAYGRFYPSTDTATDAFTNSLSAAHAAARRQQEHTRAVRDRELELLANHERPDAVTSNATLWAVIAMVVSGTVVGVIATVLSLMLGG